MAILFAKVLQVTNLPAVAEVKDKSGNITTRAIPEANSYRLSIRAKSKFAQSQIFWLTLPVTEGVYTVGESDELDSEMFYGTEKTTNTGQTIKVLKSRNLEMI